MSPDQNRDTPPAPLGEPAPPSPGDRRAHWNDRYRTIGAEAVSWFEDQPLLSLELLDLVGASASSSVIDVGGGASPLTSALQHRGFTDLTVLDVSSEALAEARRRVERPDDVAWIETDLLEWTPERQWAIWHDRAVFHFLVDARDRSTYRRRLLQALEPGSAVIIVAFAEDGPTTCSGLPVARHSPESLLRELGPGFEALGAGRSDHVTPAGSVQRLAWVAARRAGEPGTP